MSDGTLTVDLRLALKKLREDVREASQVIKSGLAKSLGVGDAQIKATRDAGSAQDQLATKTKRATSELDKQLLAWKKLQNFRGQPKVYGLPGGPMAPRPNYSGYGPTMNPTQGPMGAGGGLATGGPYLGSAPPIIPRAPIVPKAPVIPGLPAGDAQMFWRRMITGAMGAGRGTGYGSIIGANQFMGAFGGTATGGKALAGVGLSGAGGAAAASGVLLVAILALVSALKGVKMVVQQSIASAERARSLYARSLQSGLGLEGTAKRSMLAQVLGVGENEIYQYGAALAILNPRLENAAKISAQTALVVAPLSYDISILKFDLEALWNTLAADVTPVLRTVIQGFDALARGGTMLIDGFLKPAWEFISETINSKLGKVVMSGLLTMAYGDNVNQIVSSIVKAFSAGVGAQGAFPAPQSFMKQLPVSNFERMGFVAGMSSNSVVDYTRRTAVAVEVIAEHVKNPKISRAPQAPFGLDPNISNP